MDRNQRRALERTTNNLNTWYKNLPPTKKNFVEYEIEKKVIKNDRTINIVLDSCYMAAIANNTNLELLDIEKIIDETSIYIQDYKDKIDKYGGEMIKMTKELEPKVKARMKVLINGKKDKIQSIKVLERQYDIPFAELDKMWLSVKETMGIVNKHAPKKNIAEQEVKEVIEETKTVDNSKLIIKNTKDIKTFQLPYGVTEKEIEEERITLVRGPIEELGLFKSPSKLKVIEEIKKIQGEQGIYIKTTQGVKIGNITYKDITDVREEKQAIQAELEVQEQELQKELSEINKKIKEVAELKIKEDKKYEEIEDVFNM